MMVTAFVGGSITSIVMHASTTSTASTIVVPATVQAGDILVLFDRPVSGGLPAAVVPSGWSAGNQSGTGNFRMFVSYKLAVNADAGATVTGMAGSLSNAKMMYVFRPDIPALVLTPGSIVSSVVVSPSVADPTVTTLAGSATAPLVVIGAYSRNGVISPRTMSPAKDGEINASTSAYLAYKIYNSSPANVTVTTPGNTSVQSAQAMYLVPTLV